MRTFTSPQSFLGDIDPASMARLIGAASDITLILDSDGVILETAFQSGQLLDALNDSCRRSQYSELVLANGADSCSDYGSWQLLVIGPPAFPY